MKRLGFAVMSLVVGVILTLPGAAAAADKIKVVATFSVIADMVTNVAGDMVDLVTIVGPDGDCEEYEPTAADVPKMANARILFMNGLNDDFEPWLPNLMQQAKFSGTKVIVTRGVKAITAEDEHPMGGKPKATVLDQHAWMNPHNGLIYVKNITEALARARSGQCRRLSQPGRVLYPAASGSGPLGANRDGQRAHRQAACAGVT